MRESASNWEEAYSTFLESLGFAKGKASTCCFYNDSRQIRNMVHGDDFVAVGREKDLLWMKSQLQGTFEIKWETLGPREEHKNEIKDENLLNLDIPNVKNHDVGVPKELQMRITES